MVFAPDSYREPSANFYTGSNSRHLSGLSNRDNFIMTANLSPLIGPDSYRDVQKLMPTLTRTATHNPLAVMFKPACGAVTATHCQTRPKHNRPKANLLILTAYLSNKIPNGFCIIIWTILS
jgi:hypothetical protein